MAEKKAKNKPMTDKQSYRVKNEYLAENYSEVTPMEFYVNYAVVGVFALLVVFCGWQVYHTRADVKNLTQSVQDVSNGIYNSEGWSVLEGTVMNERVYSQKHPEAYQRYLQDKEKRQQQQ